MASEIKTFSTDNSDPYKAAQELLKMGLKKGEYFVWKNPANNRFYPARLSIFVDKIGIDIGYPKNDDGYENEIEAKKNEDADFTLACTIMKVMQ